MRAGSAKVAVMVVSRALIARTATANASIPILARNFPLREDISQKHRMFSTQVSLAQALGKHVGNG